MLAPRLIGLSLLTSALAACSATSESRGGGLASGLGAGGAPGPGAGSTTGVSGFGTGLVPVMDNRGGAPDLGTIMEMDPTAADCAGIVNKGEQITVDIYVMFDQSQSMLCGIPSGGDRWDAVKNALQQFVMDQAAAGINVGIQYFGLGGFASSCNAAEYQRPDVEIGPLPMNAMAIVNSLNAHMPSTNTPTPPALVGAINHAIDWKNMHPGHSVVVALVTDGQPNACGAIPDVVSAAAAGFMNTIPTYVIGVISPGTTCAAGPLMTNLDPNPPNQQDLDAVAQAGGTKAALLVDVTQNTAQQFVATMNEIRKQSVVPCQYSLPKAPAGQMLDPAKVNVEYIPPSGTTPVTILGVTMATCDPATGGWYYDNPGAPTKINLCPSTCTAISTEIGGQINIAVGCATKHPA